MFSIFDANKTKKVQEMNIDAKSEINFNLFCVLLLPYF